MPYFSKHRPLSIQKNREDLLYLVTRPPPPHPALSLSAPPPPPPHPAGLVPGGGGGGSFFGFVGGCQLLSFLYGVCDLGLHIIIGAITTAGISIMRDSELQGGRRGGCCRQRMSSQTAMYSGFATTITKSGRVRRGRQLGRGR